METSGGNRAQEEENLNRNQVQISKLAYMGFCIFLQLTFHTLCFFKSYISGYYPD
jgi:hypothetical protein